MIGPNEGVYFTFDASDVLNRLDGLHAGLSDATRQPLKGGFLRAGLVYFRDMRQRFQGAMGGDGTWPPLKPATVIAKGGDARILFRTGSLFNDVPPANFNRAIRIDRSGLQVFIVNPVAIFHQRGTRRMPQRKIFVAPRPQAEQQMRAAVAQASADAIKELWPDVRSAA